MDIETPDDWRYMSVREELDNGRLWKARDRLNGRLVNEPANQDVLGLLGDIYFAMGDLPQAGRYWWLTERDDDRADAAAKAFYERFGTMDLNVLRALPRPTRADLYPPNVRSRYEALTAAVRETGIDWKPPVRHRPADYVDVETVLKSYEWTWIDRLMSPEVVGFVALLIVVFAVFGVVTMASAVIDMVAG